MLGNLEIALIAGAAVLLFGADRLPKLGRSFGQMRQEFTRGQHEGEADVAGANGNAKTAPIDGTAHPVETAPQSVVKEADRPQP